MEQIRRKKKTEINGNALRTWAMLFLVAGVAGRGVIQTHMLGVGQASSQQLLELMAASETMMTLTTLSLVLQALETCALPIFALLLVEGVQHTSDFKAYFLRVLGIAVVTELPYNLAMNGKILALGSRNPIFALLICMVLLAFYRQYAKALFQNVLIKAMVTAAAMVWCEMLKIDFGTALVIVVAVMWAFRRNTLYRNFAGATAAIACSLISPFFMASPMTFLVIHLYNGEKSTTSRRINYLAYPAILLAAAVVGMVI